MLLSLLLAFVAGLLARLIIPGKKDAVGYAVSGALGVVGAFLTSFIGQAVGWYQPGEGAGMLGALVGAAVLIGVWQLVSAQLAKRRAERKADPTFVRAEPPVAGAEPPNEPLLDGTGGTPARAAPTVSDKRATRRAPSRRGRVRKSPWPTLVVVLAVGAVLIGFANNRIADQAIRDMFAKEASITATLEEIIIDPFAVLSPRSTAVARFTRGEAETFVDVEVSGRCALFACVVEVSGAELAQLRWL